MTMKPSTYTCRRCLNALLSSPNTPTKQTIRRRLISSSSKPSAPVNAAPSQASKPTKSKLLLPDSAKRAVSSFSSQEVKATQPDEFYIAGQGASPESERVLLKPNNLFHSFTNSPSQAIRRRAAYMRQQAYCPHPSHQRTRQPTTPLDPENRKPSSSEESTAQVSPPAHVRFECPDCGIPVACCEEHWAEDYEAHLEVCDTLRQINEDDHDLHSGRFFPEFDYPTDQRAEEFVINMSNWDTFLYTRDFNAIDDPRPMRQVTRLLTYPATVASVLHELSPYNIKKDGRMTPEGLRSFSGKPSPSSLPSLKS